ncbi:MAG: hypothetical protein AAFN10_15550 [Bacteroidota bacterium]
MKKQRWRLIGSSLIEVLSGISLLSLVLGLGLGLFQRLSGPLSAAEWSRAQSICRNVLYKSPDRAEIGQGLKEVEIHHFRVLREVAWYEEAQNICEIKVSCKWKDHVMVESVRLSRLK